MTENNNNQPLDYGVNVRQEQQRLQVTDTVAQNWATASRWLKIIGRTLFFSVFLMLIFIIKSKAEGITAIFLLITVVVFLAALFFWSSGSHLRIGLSSQKTETVEAGFKKMLWIYQHFGIIAILLCMLAGVLLLIIMNIDFSNDTF